MTTIRTDFEILSAGGQPIVRIKPDDYESMPAAIYRVAWDLSKAQAKALAELVAMVDRPLEKHGWNGLALSAWTGMMNRMCSLGVAAPYVHGGYVVTDFGRRVADERAHGRKP